MGRSATWGCRRRLSEVLLGRTGLAPRKTLGPRQGDPLRNGPPRPALHSGSSGAAGAVCCGPPSLPAEGTGGRRSGRTARERPGGLPGPAVIRLSLLRLPQRTREGEESLLTNPQPSSVLACRLGVPRSLLGLGGACQWPGGAVLARSCPRHPLGVLLRRLLRAEQSVPEPITSTGPKQVSLRLN